MKYNMSIASLLDVLVDKEEPSIFGPFTNTNKKRPGSSKNAFNDGNVDIVVSICEYLNAGEMHVFRLVNRFSKHVFTLMAGEWCHFWMRETKRKFGAYLPVCSKSMENLSSIVKYVTCQQRLIESEYKHFMSAQCFYTCFYDYCTLSRQPGIIGLVCDIGYVEDPIVAAVLSRKRYMTMLTVLTQHEQDVHRFKKALASTHEQDMRKIRSFLPVMTARGIPVDADLERVVGSTDFHVPGFIGYAVKLIKLRNEHEFMRYTVFWGLFRDLMVFKTKATAEEYRNTLPFAEQAKFWCTCLDDYTVEELDNTYPRFQSMNFRERYMYIQEPPRQTKGYLEKQIANVRYYHSIVKHTY